jgi:dTDP-glucose 4,6-dehydratase
MMDAVRGDATWLVTGGAGFIGSHFVDLALAAGVGVVVLDALTYAGSRLNLEDALAVGAELVVGDIGDRPLVDRLLREHRCTAVINFAAESHVDRSIARPAAFVETNLAGTSVLLDAALAHWRGLAGDAAAGFRFLQISTDEVFGALGPEGVFDEDSPLLPNSPYAASKAGADLLVRAWHRTYGLPVLITHSSNNYGPRQHPEKLIPRTITCALAGERLPVYGRGDNVRDWLHVLDHARGVLAALDRAAPGARYCFGGETERTNLSIVEQICGELDELAPREDRRSYREQIAFVEDRPGHDFRYAVDDRRARRDLGFAREHGDFAAGLRDTVRWYLEHREPRTGRSPA